MMTIAQTAWQKWDEKPGNGHGRPIIPEPASVGLVTGLVIVGLYLARRYGRR